MDAELPRPTLGLTIATHVFLGLLFVAGLGTIALLPSFAAPAAEALPEYAELQVPLLATSIALTALGLIAIAMIALLVARVYSATILTRSSILWVDVIITVLVCAALLLITAFFTISGAQAGSPAIAIALVIACLALIALACITLVLRSLLSGAILMRTELDEVV